MNKRWSVVVAIAVTALAADDKETRGIVPEAVLQARPVPTAGAKPAVPRPAAKYVLATGATGPNAPSPRNTAGAGQQVGVTIWRLRPGAPGETAARILVQEDASTVEWVPERVGSATSLRAGDRVRLTIESPGEGYLYVVDREKYQSGERGTPYLIFPTTRTRGGDNKVSGGKLIDIPAQDDQPNFFASRQSRPNQTEEELTVILTREPLRELTIGPKANTLTEEMVAEWERRWGTGKVERFELSGGAGRAWTRAEQVAASDASRVLTQEDPPPQTVYRVDGKAGEPLLVKVRLRYRARAAK